MSAPLRGVKVLDLSRLLPGPACTWLLQGMGASVDRVESAGRGDPARHLPPFVEGVGAYFAALSRGKRSIALDLRSEAGRDTLAQLVPHYDVLVEGFKPGVLEAMGLTRERIEELHPGLIVARLSGFGQHGPLRDQPGHDLNYAGLAGVLGQAPGAAPPAAPPVQTGDLAGAMLAATRICAALFERERTGRGAELDIALADSALAFMAPVVAGLTAEQRDPRPAGETLTGGLSVYDTYRCSDGRYLTVAPLEPPFQRALMREVGQDLSREALTTVFATAPRDVWVERLADACVGPALTPAELHEHPHWKARGVLQRQGHITWVDAPTGEGARGPVPALGEHTEAVLRECGISPLSP